MSQSRAATYPNPDKAALARAGKVAGRRLAVQPAVERIPTDQLEIYGVVNFLSPAECAGMCALIDRVARPSDIYDHGYGSDYRTSASGDVDRADPLVRTIEARIDQLLGIPHLYGEPLQGQRYLPGQQFKQHYDWFYTKADYWSSEARRGGQRCYTAMAYLNEVEEGGSTDFTHAGLSIPPQTGTLLVWNNATAEGDPCEGTMHAGTQVIRGAKYVITKWYRTRRFG